MFFLGKEKKTQVLKIVLIILTDPNQKIRASRSIGSLRVIYSYNLRDFSTETKIFSNEMNRVCLRQGKQISFKRYMANIFHLPIQSNLMWENHFLQFMLWQLPKICLHNDLVCVNNHAKIAFFGYVKSDCLR